MSDSSAPDAPPPPFMPSFPTDSASLAHQLKPVLDQIEKGRLHSVERISKGWKKISWASAITLAIILITLVTTRGPQTSGTAPLVMLPVGLIGLIYGIVIYCQFIGGHASNYGAEYKTKVIGGLTKLMQPEMNYHPTRGISESAFKRTGLYTTGVDRYHSEDLFEGSIGQTTLSFSEVHAEDKQTSTDSKGRRKTRWVTIFKGLVIIADFNKHFRSWLTIQPDFAESTFGWLGRKVQSLSRHLVRLENPEFEQAFVVHGGDQVEARYLLTPDMQERVLELKRCFGDDIRMAFRDSQFHLTMPKRENWFEPSIQVSAHDPVQMQRFVRQITAIFRMVDLLDLNTRIWTKD